VAVVPTFATTIATATRNCFTVFTLKALETYRALPIVVALARALQQVFCIVIVSSRKFYWGKAAARFAICFLRDAFFAGEIERRAAHAAIPISIAIRASV